MIRFFIARVEFERSLTATELSGIWRDEDKGETSAAQVRRSVRELLDVCGSISAPRPRDPVEKFGTRTSATIVLSFSRSEITSIK